MVFYHEKGTSGSPTSGLSQPVGRDNTDSARPAQSFGTRQSKSNPVSADLPLSTSLELDRQTTSNHHRLARCPAERYQADDCDTRNTQLSVGLSQFADCGVAAHSTSQVAITITTTILKAKAVFERAPHRQRIALDETIAPIRQNTRPPARLTDISTTLPKILVLMTGTLLCELR
ncbi:uncharacterized protein B0T23DRAFT_400566 [Neurospora hispaniola]|uniref:Uncharacterized protein n=1 Tax=Neurospora hispaniola TaxID=588809 RepID=A0AAJ0MV17_9PEZI|nr:hypothetical protein B0T23DRAFT_400566 [Neurospora hispaniola]